MAARLRCQLIEYRFQAAQALLGVVALGAGAWLLWPAPPDGVAEHRGSWQRSLQLAEQSFDGRNQAFRDGLVPVAEASRAVSAMGQVTAGRALAARDGTSERLAQIARTMPAIGVPETGPATRSVEVVLDLSARKLAPPRETGAAASARRGATALAQRGAPATVVAPAPAPSEPMVAQVPRSRPGEPAVAQVLPQRPPVMDGPAGPTWLRNAVAAPEDDGRPAIAVVIDDLGLNRRGTAALNQLKGPLTLSFLPYAGALEEQARAGRAAGHELMLHIPMEPTGHEWPGPNALLSSLAPGDLVARLRAELLSFPGFVGINNHMGSLLTAERSPMALVMAELRARGLLFLDSRTTAHSVAAEEAQSAGVPYAVRDVFLDNDTDLTSIRRQLALAERIARRRGTAVAIGHPHDATIEALRGWLPSLEGRGFVLVPVSSIVARESCANGLLLASATACGRYVSAQNTIQ